MELPGPGQKAREAISRQIRHPVPVVDGLIIVAVAGDADACQTVAQLSTCISLKMETILRNIGL